MLDEYYTSTIWLGLLGGSSYDTCFPLINCFTTVLIVVVPCCKFETYSDRSSRNFSVSRGIITLFASSSHISARPSEPREKARICTPQPSLFKYARRSGRYFSIPGLILHRKQPFVTTTFFKPSGIYPICTALLRTSCKRSEQHLALNG